jgi:hypothetical protein
MRKDLSTAVIQAVIQSGELIADSLTSLYNLRVNDTFQVQVNRIDHHRYTLPNQEPFY